MKKMVAIACMCMFALSILAVSVEAAPVQTTKSSAFQAAPSDMNCGGCEAKKECPKGEKKECCKEGEGCCKSKEGCSKDKKCCPKDKEGCNKKASCPKAEKEGA